MVGCVITRLVGMSACFAIVTCDVGAAEAASRERLKPWDSSVSAERRYFRDEAAHFSPGGQWFYFQSLHGDISCDCMKEELYVYRTADVTAALNRGDKGVRPLRHAMYQSAGPKEFGLWGVEWADAHTLRYTRLDDQGRRQLFDLDVRSGQEFRLTNWTLGAGFYPRKVGNLIFGVKIDAPVREPQTWHYPVFPVAQKDLFQITEPESRFVRKSAFVSFGGQPPFELKADGVSILSTTADGEKLIALGDPGAENIPTKWLGYDLIGFGISTNRIEMQGPRKSSIQGEVPTFLLVDAKHGTEKIIIGAPSGLATSMGQNSSRVNPPAALWSRDNRYVVLINAALPLDPKHHDVTPSFPPAGIRAEWLFCASARLKQWAA